MLPPNDFRALKKRWNKYAVNDITQTTTTKVQNSTVTKNVKNVHP